MLNEFYFYFRDGKNDKYLRVEDSPFIVKPGHMTTSHETNKRGDQADVMKGVEVCWFKDYSTSYSLACSVL